MPSNLPLTAHRISRVFTCLARKPGRRTSVDEIRQDTANFDLVTRRPGKGLAEEDARLTGTDDHVHGLRGDVVDEISGSGPPARRPDLMQGTLCGVVR